MSIGFKRHGLAETTDQAGLADLYEQASQNDPSPVLDKSEAAELVAGLLTEAFDLTYATFYAPDVPDSDLPLLSMLMVDASRGSRPWSLTMCPCGC